MMLRSIAKTGFAFAYTWSRGSRMTGRRTDEAPAPFIAGYHRVVENFHRSKARTIPSMLISKAMLERHLDWLARNFSIVPLDEIGERYETRRPSRRPAAAITFDDGYADVYHHAYPLLQRKGIPAAIFVVSGLMGTGRPQIFDRFYLVLQALKSRKAPLGATIARALGENGAAGEAVDRLVSIRDAFQVMTHTLNAFPQEIVDAALMSLQDCERLPEAGAEDLAPLTWEMIQIMHRGGMTIGSHTSTHRLLSAETIETVRSELVNSKRMLESKIGAPVHHFAYPDGRFDPSVVEAVNAAGYRYAYSICHTQDRRFPSLTIPRKMFWERSCLNALGRFSPSVMNCQVHWVFDRKHTCEHDHTQRR